ncbi:MAG: hypothetical protein NE327_02120 [Lentisphaeraceae bacterium]|nr:hypothetical protein [Lentisphaeraceae bacterium]
MSAFFCEFFMSTVFFQDSKLILAYSLAIEGGVMTYKLEKKFFTKTYTLKEKTIVIEQEARFEVDYKVEFNLEFLNLPHGTSRTFVDEFSYPVVILGLAVFFSSFFFTGYHLNNQKYVMIGLMVTGFLIMASSWLMRKKTNNVIYYNVDNAYIFEVCQYDKSKEEFDAFTAEIDKRIEMARAGSVKSTS